MKRIFQLQLGLLLMAASTGCSCLHTGELGCLQAYYGGGINCRKDCDDDDCFLEKLFCCGDGVRVISPAGLPPMQCGPAVPMAPICPPMGPMGAPACGPLSPITLPPNCTPGTVCPPTPCPPASFSPGPISPGPCSTGTCAPPVGPGGVGNALTPGVFQGTLPTGFVQGQIVSSQPVASAPTNRQVLSTPQPSFGTPTVMSSPTMGAPISSPSMPSQTTMMPQSFPPAPPTTYGGCPTGNCGEDVPSMPGPSYPELFQPETSQYYESPMPQMGDQFQMPQNMMQPMPPHSAPRSAPAPHPQPMVPGAPPSHPMPMNNGNGQHLPMGPQPQPMDIQPMPMNPQPMNPQPMPMNGGQPQPTATMQGQPGQNWVPVGF